MSKDEGNGDAAESQTTSPDAPSPKDPNAEIYENRGPKKIIRVVTVMAYLFSVSFVGILLSAYYLFLWEPPDPKLIVRERLLADPQLQFLVAAVPPSIEDVATVQASVPAFENELNQTYKTLTSRLTEDADDDPDIQKRRRMNATLLSLRRSLVEAQRARRLNVSREVTTLNVSDDLSVPMKEVLNSTKLVVRAEDSISGDKNTSEGRIQSTGPPPELADSTLDAENASSTIPGAGTKQSHLDEEFATDVNRRAALAVHRERGNRSYGGKLDAARASDDITNRARKDNNSAKVVWEIDPLDDNEELQIKRNETDERQLIDDDRKNPNNSSDVRAIAPPEGHVEDRANHRVSAIYAVVNNLRRNYFDSKQKTVEKIARDKVSIGSPPSRDAGFTDDPKSHQPPDEPSTVIKQRPYVTADSKETQVERVIERPAMIDDKQLEEIDLSTTQGEILTETTDIEKTSVELTSVSTARDYLNFTSTANDNDDESVT